MRSILLMAASVVAISCSSFSQPINKKIESKIGWMHGNCLAIKNSDIPSQHHFTLIHLDDEKTTEKALMTKKITKGGACYPLLEDRVSVNKGNGYYFYLVTSKKPVDLAVGILGREDISGLDFDFCNTTEGIQFSVSKKSAVIWEGYYYLGYESESTCIKEPANLE